MRKLLVIENESNRHKYTDLNIEFSSTFNNPVIPIEFRNAEGILFTAYPFDKNWLEEMMLQLI